MIHIDPRHVTSELMSLFAIEDPASQRGQAVLNGDLAGYILIDQMPNPKWGLIREAGGGTTLLSQVIDESSLPGVIAMLQQTGPVVIGLGPNDVRWPHLPVSFDQAGMNVEFLERDVKRHLDAYLQTAPPTCQIRPIDPDLFIRCAWYAAVCRQFGSADRFFQKGLGFCLTSDDTILAEAYLSPAVQGVREIGLRTNDAYRGRGYGTLLSAYAITLCEQRGDRVYWNTAQQNQASLAIGRKMGFQTERAYPVWIWRALG